MEDAERAKKAENLENVALRERVEILRQANVRIENKVSDDGQALAQKASFLQIKLDEYERAEDDILRALDSLAKQDTDWHQEYLRSVLGIPKGPKKLQAAVHIANRLEQKIREVTLLRTQILELQKQFLELKEDHSTAKSILTGSKDNSHQYFMNLILQKDSDLKEALRIKKRQDADYGV